MSRAFVYVFYDEMYLSLRVFVRGDSIWLHLYRLGFMTM